ncbi:uncharacterized protein LOC107884336 [Acyrthosiphon pisum]|uniref:Gustatory receptor n=1 Tax=Acyrthosiphon pisum TaxID=7029 RepID=A0A8R2NN89_ACYPI|nr:uncharacterized protein LOC107884336 [Acyrthosiphon pisum]XP_029344096.1 uncharacterized protein LOC107884336 [Acyrthosiphon pisum]|eukprot:XP_016661656.1 PREDICTED: uncharacterized protein LOC107884336 [Acyrthosiphon pisum]
MFGLQHFGVISFDSNNDNNIYQIAYTVILFITGISLIIVFPLVNDKFDDWSKAFSMSLTVVTCSSGIITSLISRMIVVYNIKFKYQKFKTTLEGFEIYIPMNSVASKHIKYFSFSVIFFFMSFIIATNSLRLFYIFNNHVNPFLMTTFFGLYYMHNLSMVCTELHFSIQCFLVYTKFRDINEKLIQINDEQKYYNFNVRYSFTGTQVATPRNSDDKSPPCVIMYEKDFYCPKDKSFPLANTIELFRIRHWLSREAINDIKCLFGFQMGMSIIILAVTVLFDIYTELFYSYTNSSFSKSVFRSKILFIGWMLQYSTRLGLIIVTAHTTIQQAVKTKKLITEMNNRHTDSNTKEELQLFYNQLSICSPEFTIFDILTINNSLITSMMSAGATYILILVQFQSEKTTHKNHYLSNRP